MDEEFGGNTGPQTPSVLRGSEVTAGEGKWAQLETWEQGRKENVQAPGKWAGAKLKQKKGLVAAIAPVLDIPEDEELTELGGTPSYVHATPKVKSAVSSHPPPPPLTFFLQVSSVPWPFLTTAQRVRMICGCLYLLPWNWLSLKI